MNAVKGLHADAAAGPCPSEATVGDLQIGIVSYDAVK